MLHSVNARYRPPAHCSAVCHAYHAALQDSVLGWHTIAPGVRNDDAMGTMRHTAIGKHSFSVQLNAAGEGVCGNGRSGGCGRRELRMPHRDMGNI
eukprot:116109-Chlamydomonas_euryale.AAC.2